MGLAQSWPGYFLFITAHIVCWWLRKILLSLHSWQCHLSGMAPTQEMVLQFWGCQLTMGYIACVFENSKPWEEFDLLFLHQHANNFSELAPCIIAVSQECALWDLCSGQAGARRLIIRLLRQRGKFHFERRIFSLPEANSRDDLTQSESISTKNWNCLRWAVHPNLGYSTWKWIIWK